MKGAGFTKFSNSVLQALPHVRACAGIKDTVLAIIRLTWGWQAKERVLSYDDICLMTGYTRAHQYRYVRGALKLNLISRYLIGTEKPRYCYSPNGEPHSWKASWRIRPQDFTRLLTRLMSPKQETRLSPKQETRLSPKQETDILGIIIDTPIR